MVGRGDYDPQTGLHEYYERPAKPLGAVVGENVRRLREEKALTQHELCQRWRRYGLRWARSKLAALENGHREQVSFADVVLMAMGLHVPVVDLLAGEGDIQFTPHAVRMSREDTRKQLTGRGRGGKYHLDDPELYREAAERQWGYRGMSVEADAELAKRLGRPLTAVAKAASQLFDGLTLTAERDRRVERMGELAPAERQAHRGHVTRELSQQLQRYLERSEEE